MSDFPCPCCGHLVFDEEPGSYWICPVCDWEDDRYQLCYPFDGGGANQFSLFSSQRRGARKVEHEYRRDPGWRPIDLDRDHFEPSEHDFNVTKALPDDGTLLYYWRSSYWLRDDPSAYKYGRYCPLPRRTFTEDEIPEARARLMHAIELLAGDDRLQHRKTVNALCFRRPKPLLAFAGGNQAEDFGIDLGNKLWIKALGTALTDLNSICERQGIEANDPRILEASALVGAVARRLRRRWK